MVALLDSRATGLFVDANCMARHQLTTWPSLFPILIYNINGIPNEAGSIPAVVDLVLRYQVHAKHAIFAVTSLEKHNLEID